MICNVQRDRTKPNTFHAGCAIGVGIIPQTPETMDGKGTPPFPRSPTKFVQFHVTWHTNKGEKKNGHVMSSARVARRVSRDENEAQLHQLGIIPIWCKPSPVTLCPPCSRSYSCLCVCVCFPSLPLFSVVLPSFSPDAPRSLQVFTYTLVGAKAQFVCVCTLFSTANTQNNSALSAHERLGA